ncbi:MAG: polysaccharide deacetylase family protein [Bacteroidales bacterium]|nr:polysaccharide deacetylase family protein [Bacteroidales bacterium]
MIGYLHRKIHNIMHPVLGRILMLHRVVEQRSEGENRALEITPEFLKQTINDYRRKGYRFVSIDEACDIIKRGRTKHPFVCLSFDDGYQDNYDIAYPILKQMEVPFAVYVTTGFIDNRIPMWWYRCESREQCQTCLSNAEVQQCEHSYSNEMLGISAKSLHALDADPLCTIGAHTISHTRLDTLSPEEQTREIVQSRQELEALLGHPIRHFSYPHGDYNADTLKIINDCHFVSSLRAWGGTIRKGDVNLLELPRIELKEQ